MAVQPSIRGTLCKRKQEKGDVIKEAEGKS